MVLVIGATGMLGGEVCRQLIAKGKPVRAMVRNTTDPIKLGKLRSWGVDLVYGDLRNPSTFTSVFDGIDMVISTVSSMPFSYVPNENDIQKVDFEGMKRFIESAKNNKVKQFVYTSFSKQMDVDFPLRNAKRKVEKYLQDSGMPYTILRPSCFMEVWLSPAVGFDVDNANVSVYGDGTQPVSYISYIDVAKLAVQCIQNPNTLNKEFELGGPKGVSQLDAVKIFEKIMDEKFQVQHVPLEALRTQRESAKDPMQKSFTGLKECVAKGDFIDMREVSKVLPVKLTSVEEYAKTMFVPA
jgi:uncharacterized protein YbjT (DUF2867 family)